MSMLEAGQSAPDFSLPGDSASKIRMRDFRGRNLVLYFYPKDDTSGCTRKPSDFSALKPDFEAASTDVVGISADSAKSHDKFKAKHDLDLRLASDEDHEVLEAYGVWAEKSVWQEVLRRGAHHLSDRSQGQDLADLAESEGGRARSGSS